MAGLNSFCVFKAYLPEVKLSLSTVFPTCPCAYTEFANLR